MAVQNALPKWTELAVGTAITEPGSARQNPTGDWRSSRPIWNHSECIRCGVCVLFCPEGCVKFNHQVEDYPNADLKYCKGCGICAHECPTACISMMDEEE